MGAASRDIKRGNIPWGCTGCESQLAAPRSASKKRGYQRWLTTLV